MGTYTIPGAEGNAPVDIPLWQSNINLTPEGQRRQDQENRIVSNIGNVAESGLGRVGTTLAKPFDFGSASDARTQAQDAIMSRIEPQLARDREALRTQLINQGFRIGTEGYDQAMRRADQQATDARFQAIQQAAPEQDRMVQLASFLRSQPLNELNALRSGSQVTMPQFQGYYTGSAVAPAPVMAGAQAAGNAAQQAYQTQSGNYNSMMGGLFGLGSAGLGAYGMMNAAPLLAR